MHVPRVKEGELVAVVGLGKVGLGLAAAFARAGFDVLGVDRDAALVQRINTGTARSEEPGVADVLIGRARGRLRATTDMGAAVDHSAIVFILLPTPSAPDGGLDAGLLVAAVAELCAAIRRRPSRSRIVVIGSTVSPGTMHGDILPAMERALGEPVGGAVAVCYSPELIALGSVVENFECPDLILIGACDPAAGAEVERMFRGMVRNEPAVHHLSLIDAEIAKVALNNYLTVKISFANWLAQLCVRTPGANVDAVTGAIGADRRIGPQFLRAGPPFGGPCFPRDTAALSAWARSAGVATDFIDGVVAVNDAQQHLLTATVRQALTSVEGATVAILGLAYKMGTPYVIGSPSMVLAAALHTDGVRVVAHDLHGIDAAVAGLETLGDPAACVEAASVIVLMHAAAAYVAAIRSYDGSAPKVVVDAWRAMDGAAPPHVTVVGLGQWRAPA